MESSQSSSAAAEDSNTVNKRPTTLLTNSGTKNDGQEKRAMLLPSEGIISGEETTTKRQRTGRFVLNLSDVPPQPPIPKRKGQIKGGSSRYTGVSFNKANNIWEAGIMIDGKKRRIGYYENEEDAAIDYARAIFKYRCQEALEKARERKKKGSVIDLSDVPLMPPITRRENMKGAPGSSKYTGVSFHKSANKWEAGILIEGKKYRIGYYENEEEAAIDYARAVFKYKGQEAMNNLRERNSSAPAIDLSDVPPQPPIPDNNELTKKGTSKYAGVSFNKAMNKWKAQISTDGKQKFIGYYDNEEDAATDYARAVFKYKGQTALEKAREQSKSEPAINIDLSDIPPQLPIPKCEHHVKERTSKYVGVYFHKSKNKWEATIQIEGKNRHIGYYENEEEAAVDYARAVLKYKGQGALAKLRERSVPAIDLSDVPPQPPIPKSKGYIKEGASKYAGVHFVKKTKKWRANIKIEGKARDIGYYENEEDAAIDYARALFKYRGQGGKEVRKRQRADGFGIDLADVPPQTPIPKSGDIKEGASKGRRKEGSSKYAGVLFDKKSNKWHARIKVDGKRRSIGYYEKEEEAAIDYARAKVKYGGQEALDKARERNKSEFRIDLNGVPPQLPIPRSKGRMKEGSSMYAGVYLEKATNKWLTRIMLEGKKRHIGYYENEEKAAIDYARAVFKYKGQEALDKAREVRKSSLTNGSDIKNGGGKKRALPPKDVVSGRDVKQRLEKADSFVFDLSGVPQQPPILKSKGRIKEGASKYTGVSFHKPTKKWMAKIIIEGKARHIGLYKNEEEAAIDYARAVFKYKPRGI